MTETGPSHGDLRQGRARSVVVLSGLLLAIAAAAFAYTMVGDDEPSAADRDALAAGSEAPTEDPAAELAEQWGVEIASVRLTAENHMIDYRYRVLDAEKATELFKRKIKPRLIHEKSGKVLSVPETAKLGPLRNSNTPKAGKTYWMFFGNAGKLVKAGDAVSVVIGDFRVDDLRVE